MSDNDITTVKVSRETWQDLNSRKTPGDSFDDIIRELIEQDQPCSADETNSASV